MHVESHFSSRSSMFDIVRNNKKVAQIILALIILPFAFWGVESYIGGMGRTDSVAEVGGSKISKTEFEQALREQQEQLRASLAGRLAGAGEMQRRLVLLGAPAHPRELGLDVQQLARDYRRARLIRRRYTLLDALEDLGWLDRAVAELCAPGGFWGEPAQPQP